MKIELKATSDFASKVLEMFATGQGPLKTRGITEIQASIPGSPGAKSVSLRRMGTAAWGFVGREAEISQLDELVGRGEARVITIVAAGGVGKTTLVAQWMALLAQREWLGFDAVFDWSFYSQGTHELVAPSSDLFLTEALAFFGDNVTASSAQGAFAKGRRLAQLISERRALLVLDGLEPLQYAPTSPTPGLLKDQGLAALLKGLAAASQGLCIVTTRHGIADLGYHRQTVSEIQLKHLSVESGMALLRSLGVKGTEDELAKLVYDMGGHALSLQLIGSYLHHAHQGDVRHRDSVKLELADKQEQGNHAFRVMEAYTRSLENEGENGRRALALLSLLGLFDRPTAADCLAALLRPPAISGLTELLEDLDAPRQHIILARLEASKLVSVYRDGDGTLLAVDAHPLIREYFARRLCAEHLEGWRLAHLRIFKHLMTSASDKEQPTLEDLQPLYQAIAHGCQAGLQPDALRCYKARILRRDENYSVFKLGAIASDLGAMACFFDIPWVRVTPALSEADQAWLLNNTSFYLRSLGRLAEAVEPMRAGLEDYVKRAEWRNAAQAASNLSELELILGRIVAAELDAAQSTTYADRSGDSFVRMALRTTHADALHHAGLRSEAETRFREAEQIQKERQPAYPLLYSVQGFRYCDLLLCVPECAAWQHLLSLNPQLSILELSNTCGAVSQRAAVTLKWAEEENWLLDAALDHLALGRAIFLEAVLGGKITPEFDGFAAARQEMDVSVSLLRRAGAQEFIARGLLSRAWLRFLMAERTGPESAQADLDEAWEISERGPMKLLLADIHLHRVRLFFREASYPWTIGPQADVAAAERLINDSGYHRRDQELADAKSCLETHQM